MVMVLALVGFQSMPWAQETPSHASPIALVAAPDGNTLYVAQHTANRVDAVSLAADAETRPIPLPARPTGLALSPDGATLYVTTDGPSGQLLILDAASGNVRTQIACGHTPTSPVVSPDGARVYVCGRFDGKVLCVDAAAHSVAASVDLVREPIAAAITPNGASLVVANHLPAGPANGAYSAAVVSVIDTASMGAPKAIPLPNGSTSLRGVCVSPDGAYAYVTHILARYQLPTTQLERGWMNTNALSVIDVANASLLNTVLLDSVDLGAANPWGVACTADGAYLAVAHAGTHELSVIDRAALHDKLTRVAEGQAVSEVSRAPEDVPNDLSFLVGMRRRVRLGGNGPRALAVVKNTAYAAEYFTDSLATMDLAGDEYTRPGCIALGGEQALSPERQGEVHFNDASLCFQHWQSCASCHPDARADALNWDLLNDGMGNPKNTKNMLFAHVTPPAMITGIRPKAEDAVRAGIRHIQFAVRPEEDAEAIDAYLKSLQPVPSPSLVDGAMGEAALRGKTVFDSAGCAQCHPGPLFTDLKPYDVGTGTGREADMAFDTPSLVELWRTAPYLHDGRSATVEEVLTTHNPADKHGMTSDLSPEAIQDLAAYLRAIPAP